MLIRDSRVTYGSKISPRIWEDNNNQLICRDAIIARTGSYDYLESEIKPDGDPNKIVKVYRTDEEVFNPKSMASFENKPFVDDHPQEDVDLRNYKTLSKGFIRDIRRGTGNLSNCLICDIVVTDMETIDKIKSGRKRELSLGYDTVIVEKGGRYIMTDIVGNHLALVNNGRAGCATIRDNAIKNKIGGYNMRRGQKSKITLFDDDIYEVEEITQEAEDCMDCYDDDDEIEKKEFNEFEEEKKVTDDENFKEEVFVRLDKILRLLEENGFHVNKVDEDSTEEEVGEDLEEEKSEEELEESEVLDAKPTKSKAKDTYAKFARIGDTRVNTLKEEVTQAFADRYAKAAGRK